MKKTQKGFTLVELLVVIAILAILATVSVVGYTSFIERADESNALSEAHQVETIISSAVIGVDYVAINTDGDTDFEFYAYRNGNAVAFVEDITSVTGYADTWTFEDITADLGTLAAKLAYSTTTEITYTYKTGVVVNVIAGKVQ